MIKSCNILDPEPYAPGWLRDYCNVMGRNVAPWSFHLLSAFLVLSSVVGRRVPLVLPAGTLWPPTSILLLGSSGVGKSLALKKAQHLIKLAMGPNEDFYQAHGGFTCAGVREQWRRMQRRQNLDCIEGVHFEDEVSGLLKEKTGTEAIATWIIRALGHEDLIETLRDGQIEIRNLTIAFGFGSTIEYLRHAISIGDFAGGFMHRFLIAHDTRQRDVDGVTPTEAELGGLARSLVALRESAAGAGRMKIECQPKLDLYRRQGQDKRYDSIHLQGYWNRYAERLLKIGSLYAIAKGEFVVRDDDIEMARSLLDGKLYPVLHDVIDEVGASREKKALLDVSDSLLRAGEDGWPLQTLYRKMNVTNARGQREGLASMIAQGMVYQTGERVYAKQEWAVKAAG